MDRATKKAAVGVASALLGGLILRLWNLGAQILGGDELHAIRAVLELPFHRLLVTYRPQDACLPLSALYRLLLDAGLPLTESLLRLPIVVSGALLIVVLPWLVRRSVGATATVLFAWLLALSPILVLYGRIVRSYTPMVLLSLAAVLVFFRWLEQPRRRLAAAYVLLAVLAVYFHLVVTAFVLTPLAFAAVERLLEVRKGERRPRDLGPLLGMGLAVVLGIAAFLIPGWASLGPMIGEKRQVRWPDLETIAGVSRLQSGQLATVAVALFYGLVLVGLVVLWRRRRRFGLFTLALLLGHYVGLAILRPLNLHLPPQHTRYALVVVPLLLLWVAVALAAGVEAFRRRRPGRSTRWLTATAAAALLALSVVTGPFGRPIYRTTAFTHHKDLLGFYRPPGRLPPEEIPAFYRQVAAAPEPATILEYPWHTSWRLARTPYIYQQVHGQRLLVASVQEELTDPRIQLRNQVAKTPEAFLESPARYLVVHLDWGEEEDRVRGDDRSPEVGWHYRFREWKLLRSKGQVMARHLEGRWGPADFAEDGLRVWDLERVRGVVAGTGSEEADGLFQRSSPR